MPGIRDGGWVRSLDRRLDELEAEGPVGIPWDEVLSRIRWYRRGRGLLGAVGVGLRPGDRLAELVFILLNQRPPPCAAAWSWCSSVVSPRDVGTTLGPDRN